MGDLLKSEEHGPSRLIRRSGFCRCIGPGHRYLAGVGVQLTRLAWTSRSSAFRGGGQANRAGACRASRGGRVADRCPAGHQGVGATIEIESQVPEQDTMQAVKAAGFLAGVRPEAWSPASTSRSIGERAKEERCAAAEGRAPPLPTAARPRPQRPSYRAPWSRGPDVRQIPGLAQVKSTVRR